MSEKRAELKRVLSRADVLVLAFGTMVGWGWLILAGGWVDNAGIFGAIIAFLIGAMMCVFVGLTYSELTPALPLAGGELVFSYRGLGYHFSWFTGWAIAFAYVGVAAWESIAVATAIDYLFELPRWGALWEVAGVTVYASWALIGVLGALLLTILNYFGAKPAAIFQLVATIGLILVGLIFVVGGVAGGSPKNALPVFTSGAGMVAVLLMAPSMFVGFDVIPQSAEEMNIPLRQIGNILIISVIMATAWYILVIFGIAFAAPIEVRESAAVPVADSLAYALGSPIMGKVIIIGGLCGILTSWNGFILGATRVLFSMGRAKMLPRVFGKIHPTYKTPTASIFLVGFLCMLSPFLGKNALVWFVDASAFGTVLAYLMVSISFLVLRKKEPNLERPFFVKYGGFVGWVAVLTALFFITLYLPFGPGSLVWPHEWLLVFIWFGLGLIFALIVKFTQAPVTVEQREQLMFGEKYKRD